MEGRIIASVAGRLGHAVFAMKEQEQKETEEERGKKTTQDHWNHIPVCDAVRQLVHDCVSPSKQRHQHVDTNTFFPQMSSSVSFLPAGRTLPLVDLCPPTSCWNQQPPWASRWMFFSAGGQWGFAWRAQTWSVWCCHWPSVVKPFATLPVHCSPHISVILICQRRVGRLRLLSWTVCLPGWDGEGEDCSQVTDGWMFES